MTQYQYVLFISVEGGAIPIVDHPVCSSSVTSDDDDDLTVDVTSIEDVTVAAGEEDDEDANGGECSTPCPASTEFLPEDCQEEQAPCPRQEEPGQDNNIGESTQT